MYSTKGSYLEKEKIRDVREVVGYIDVLVQNQSTVTYQNYFTELRRYTYIEIDRWIDRYIWLDRYIDR